MGMFIASDGTEAWYKDDIVVSSGTRLDIITNLCCHRLDGPAMITKDGGRSWWVNGRLHRLDGPALEFNDHIEWWANGVLCFNFKDFQVAGGLSDMDIMVLRLKYGEIYE